MTAPDAGRVAALRRAVALVALLNLAYAGVEGAVALSIGSVSLFADAVDFLEDTAVNVLIFVALGWHAWVGVRDIWMDYVKPVGLRFVMDVFSIVWLVGCVGWGIQVLWRL